jgi:hypothetical protein
MRLAIPLLLLVAVLASCREAPRASTTTSAVPAATQGRRSHAVFVERLDELGYFRHLKPDQADGRRAAILREGWPALFSGPPHRLNPADAEDLAAGGVGEFLRLVRPFLAAEGVRLPELRDDHGAAGYVLHLGDTPTVIYAQPELRRDRSGEEPGLTWGLSAVRTFALINRLLAEARSPERVYAVGGGNDLFAFFLTPELRELIARHPDADPADEPYEPREEYPGFGQPELEEDMPP